MERACLSKYATILAPLGAAARLGAAFQLTMLSAWLETLWS
jgi:hypothetical protein